MAGSMETCRRGMQQWIGPCRLCRRQSGSQISLVALVETDDLLFGGKGKELEVAMNDVRSSFKFGHWRTLLHKPAEYSGRRLVQTADFGFEIDMTQYLVEKQGQSRSARREDNNQPKNSRMLNARSIED
eukprot:2950481-Amphidinium_carterae.3